MTNRPKTVLVIVAHADDMEFMAGVGRWHGMAFAEEFRRQRFGGIERWARESGAQPDDL
ncbi:MAG: hypothetical protein Q7R32_14880 [Dehalococcoidia bacterium]|nr:hypothetical protein [Dehalococcoidia bacterium]